MRNSFDLNELCLGNCHIHTNYSTCARKEMSIENIIHTAELNKLQSISLTDHHHQGNQDLLEHLHYLQNEVEKINSSVQVHVGASFLHTELINIVIP